MLDLTDARLFVEVSAAGSITAGAARMNLALAAASARIRLLEARFGAALLTRERRGVSLTAAGQTLLRHARALVEEEARLTEAMAAFAGGAAGTVRLIANTNASAEFLPEALSKFLAAHPQVAVELEERLSDEIVGLVAEGAADIGIAAGTVEFGALTTLPFRRDRFVVVAPAGHRLAGEIRFADILAEPLVGLDRGSAWERFLADKAARHGVTLRPRVRLRSFDAVCRLVEQGVGIGVVPQTTAQRAVRSMALTVLPLGDDWADRQLMLCVRDLDALRPSARDLVEALRDIEGSPQTRA
jgi:DNA-binding transcriptional LysR family regulator